MPWFLIVAAIVALTVAMVLLMPKPKFENARASSLDDTQFPTAKEGMPIGLALGTVRVRGPNCVWYGDFEAKPIKKKQKTGLFSSTTITVGYEYFIGMDLVLVLGSLTTHLKKIWIDKDVVWTGDCSVSGTAIAINKPDLFGGKEQGGGFVGTLRFYQGTFTETVNGYLASKITDPLGVPAYNGKTRLVFEHPNIGESNQMRPFSFELSNMTASLPGLVNPWIGEDLNPVELLYQVLTLEWGGMAVSPVYIDTASFVAVGATLYTEGNGMSLLITNETDGKTVIGEILRQIDGMLYQDPETFKMVLRLIRKDYDVLALPILDESVISAVTTFSSNSWTDTINQLRVTYTNRDNEYQDGTAMAKDMANINSQLKLKSTTVSFPGITSGTLANIVAHRELAQLCIPLFKASLELNRMVSNFRPGDLFIFSWPEYNISQIVMRVMKFNLGELLNGKIVIEALQDEFAVNATVIAAPASSGWVPRPDQTASPVTQRLVRESHYFFFQASSAQGTLTNNKSGILTAAKAPDANAQYAEVEVSKDAGVSYSVADDQLQFTAIGTLVGAITATANLATGIIPSITISGVAAGDLPAYSPAETAAGCGMFIVGGEYFIYSSVTPVGGNFQLNNVYRGLLDSVPAAHAIADAVYILSGDNFIDDVYDGTAVLKVRLVTKTIDETLDEAAAPIDNITLKNRVFRPACPQDIKFNGGAAFTGPADPSVPVVITWANRNRTSQTVRGICDATSEYETGQQTTIRYKINAGAWVPATYAPGVTTATITTGATAGQTVAWEIFSTRDGLDSFNKWTFTSTGGGGAGSGGGGDSPDTGGPPPVDGTPGYTDISNKISIVFPFGTTIGTDSIDIPITFGMTIPAALAGTNVDHDVNPAAIATFTFKKNGATVATVAISVGGAYTLTAAAAFDLDPADSFRCYPPAVADATLAGVSITIAATRKP